MNNIIRKKEERKFFRFNRNILFTGLTSFLTDTSVKMIYSAFISDLTDRNKKGTGLGIYNALPGITLLPASLIAGTLYDKIDSHIPFYFGAAIATLSAFLMGGYMVINRRSGNHSI